jgi:beta-galactosidase
MSLILWGAVVGGAQSTATAPVPTPVEQTLDFPNVLYGAAYYNEYMPGDQSARLDKDVSLMKAAGLSVVRMGESTWSLWEPEDGQFDYAWMDRVVDAMGKAGIKVILGTPTYSIPAWMAHQHPEILARTLNPKLFGGPLRWRARTGCGRTWTPTRRLTAFMPSASSATLWRITKTTPP